MQTTWNLKQLLPKNLDQHKSRLMVNGEKEAKDFAKEYKNQKKYLNSPESLLKALDEYNRIISNYYNCGSIGYYYSLSSQLNEFDSDIKAGKNQTQNWWLKTYNNIQFFEIDLSKIPEVQQKKFLSSPLLTNYRHYLEKLFRTGKHTLSDAEEKIVNLTSSSGQSDWAKLTSSLISKEEIKGKNFSQLLSEVNDQNKSTRDKAFQNISKILEKYSDIAEVEINALLGRKGALDPLRGYTRPDAGRFLADDMEAKTVDCLIDIVSSKNYVANEYYRLKALLLGKRKLDYQERNVPIQNLENKYTYPKALAITKKVFKNLDAEFEKILDRLSENGQIDVYPKKGKRMGAFCSYNTLKTPTYIMLNHTDKLTDVLTLAHESGHAINDELMRAKQPEHYFQTSLATAEVASTFFEDFVLEDIKNHLPDDLRLTLIMEKLNNDISTIFRQVACFRFEQELHQAHIKLGYLSKQQISDLFVKHMQLYMGKHVKHPQAARYFWIHWHHIRTPFYVYSYASGLLISKSLQAMVRKDKNTINLVKEFLSAGSSQSPKEIFANLGLDIAQPTFWQQGLKEVEDLLAEATNLAKSLGKI